MESTRHLGLILFGTLSLSGLILTKGMNWKRNSMLLSPSNNKKGKEHDIILADKNNDDYVSKTWMNIYSNEKGDLVNDGDDDDVELEVINDLNETILLCWVDSTGKLHHYHPISDGSIKDGSVSNRHVEYTNTNDAFVFIRPPITTSINSPTEAISISSPGTPLSPVPFKVSTPISSSNANKKPSSLVSRLPHSPVVVKSPNLRRDTLKKSKVVGSTTRTQKVGQKSESLVVLDDDKLPQYLSEVSDDSFICIYKPYLSNHQHSLTLCKDDHMNIKASVSYRKIEKGETINNFNKVYEPRKMQGFQIYAEAGVFDDYRDLHSILEQELKMVKALLPSGAEKKLKEDTPLYINKSITFGDTRYPTVGRGSTYHPKDGQKWLKANGMSEKKAGAIEMYTVKEHLKSKEQWGIGGILLHEFAHAYHDKHCPDGFDCDLIRKAYHSAMSRKLYDCVPVHGPQGENGPIKAYACTNPMEFFAELSVAYLYHSDFQEYNKWFPHNRSQLRKHDPNTCKILNKLWYC